MTLNISRQQHSRDPQPKPTVREVQTLLNRKNSHDIRVDGDFGSGSEASVKTFQRRIGLAVDGVVGPKTWAALAGAISPTPRPSGRTGKALAALAYKVVTGGYHGGHHPQYVFGAECRLFHPEEITKTDCSELVQVCVSYLIKQAWYDGTWVQYPHTKHISVAEALRIPGALLFTKTDGKIHHVAVSLGDGRTAEARNSRRGCGVWSAGSRFNLAGLVKELSY